jgi:hypothetical protein
MEWGMASSRKTGRAKSAMSPLDEETSPRHRNRNRNPNRRSSTGAPKLVVDCRQHVGFLTKRLDIFLHWRDLLVCSGASDIKAGRRVRRAAREMTGVQSCSELSIMQWSLVEAVVAASRERPVETVLVGDAGSAGGLAAIRCDAGKAGSVAAGRGPAELGRGSEIAKGPVITMTPTDEPGLSNAWTHPAGTFS